MKIVSYKEACESAVAAYYDSNTREGFYFVKENNVELREVHIMVNGLGIARGVDYRVVAE